MSNPTDNTMKEEESTHLMIVRHAPDNVSPPAYFDSLKAATDEGTEIIKKNPDAECDIYQIRTRLKGKIEISRKDFNSGKAE